MCWEQDERDLKPEYRVSCGIIRTAKCQKSTSRVCGSSCSHNGTAHFSTSTCASTSHLILCLHLHLHLHLHLPLQLQTSGYFPPHEPFSSQQNLHAA